MLSLIRVLQDYIILSIKEELLVFTLPSHDIYHCIFTYKMSWNKGEKKNKAFQSSCIMFYIILHGFSECQLLIIFLVRNNFQHFILPFPVPRRTINEVCILSCINSIWGIPLNLNDIQLVYAIVLFYFPYFKNLHLYLC